MFCINGGKEYEKIYRCGFSDNIVSGAGSMWGRGFDRTGRD